MKVCYVGVAGVCVDVDCEDMGVDDSGGVGMGMIVVGGVCVQGLNVGAGGGDMGVVGAAVDVGGVEAGV